MAFVPMMWGIWAALVLFFAVLKIYIGRLNRDEDDQLVLDDSFQRVRDEQAEIAARLGKIQPVVRTASYLVGVMTLFVAGYYILDIIRQFE